MLELAQSIAGGTDELIDLLGRSETADRRDSTLNALSEALFQRAEGTDLGDAAAANRAALPQPTANGADNAALAARCAVAHGSLSFILETRLKARVAVEPTRGALAFKVQTPRAAL